MQTGNDSVKRVTGIMHDRSSSKSSQRLRKFEPIIIIIHVNYAATVAAMVATTNTVAYEKMRQFKCALRFAVSSRYVTVPSVRH